MQFYANATENDKRYWIVGKSCLCVYRVYWVPFFHTFLISTLFIWAFFVSVCVLVAFVCMCALIAIATSFKFRLSDAWWGNGSKCGIRWFFCCFSLFLFMVLVLTDLSNFETLARHIKTSRFPTLSLRTTSNELSVR